MLGRQQPVKQRLLGCNVALLCVELLRSVEDVLMLSSELWPLVTD